MVVCSAGLATPAYFSEASLDVHRKTMDLNYFGSLNCARAAIPSMQAVHAGHIVFVRYTE